MRHPGADRHRAVNAEISPATEMGAQRCNHVELTRLEFVQKVGESGNRIRGRIRAAIPQSCNHRFLDKNRSTGYCHAG